MSRASAGAEQGQEQELNLIALVVGIEVCGSRNASGKRNGRHERGLHPVVMTGPEIVPGRWIWL